VIRSPYDFKISLMSDLTLYESALFSGLERSLRSSASINSERREENAAAQCRLLTNLAAKHV